MKTTTTGKTIGMVKTPTTGKLNPNSPLVGVFTVP